MERSKHGAGALSGAGSHIHYSNSIVLFQKYDEQYICLIIILTNWYHKPV
jgi:hypothetical protein